ncbi:uncharacterized protein LOC110106316 isoform X1 [Dendrobium catenatum]|uniref:uncharacterized protein LOC110106316 isoform X1 n=1 Tax=Dendrobium catenatum TaxID=906689 RepID=UPI00109EFDB1|nr:uncharacterized protein LOC110106316 isoform X1 [Dendrobium catenatum]
MGDEGISEYEKRRLTRIAENKARLETLGLPHLAFSLIGSSSKQPPKARDLKKSKDKRLVGAGDEEDEDYRPSDDDAGAEQDGEGESSVDSEEEEENARASSISRWKIKKRSSLPFAKVKRRSNVMESQNESDFIDDEAALMQAIALSVVPYQCLKLLLQAIALSVGATSGDSAGTSVGVSQDSAINTAGEDAQGKKYKAKAQESARRKKPRKLNKAPVQLTEDEVTAYFFSFDETGKGYITTRDVKKMVTAHDFSWTDIEIAHMIHSFDSDGDGKLSLEDFRSIVSRCKMIQATEKT